MDGKLDKIIDELFEYAEYAVEVSGWPYASFIIKNGVIVARDFNLFPINKDPSAECSISAIRSLQNSLETNDLSDYTLLSLFEPTILSLDIALWAKINKFIWCINATSRPNHYFTTKYTPTVYASKNKGIEIQAGIREKEALILIEKLEKKSNYFDIRL